MDQNSEVSRKLTKKSMPTVMHYLFIYLRNNKINYSFQKDNEMDIYHNNHHRQNALSLFVMKKACCKHKFVLVTGKSYLMCVLPLLDWCLVRCKFLIFTQYSVSSWDDIYHKITYFIS